jgi:hypothetical protein
MIGRKTLLACTALIAVMLAAAAWRIVTLDDWTTLTDKGTTVPSLLLLFFPACSALVVGSLYHNAVGATADAVKLRPWRQWGKLLALIYCAGMLALEAVLIAASDKLGVPWLPAIARTLGIIMAIAALLSINRMPKLPYLEQTFGAGLQLGPIYGPRYVRIVSRMLVVFMLALIAYSLVAAAWTGWRSTVVVVLLATAGLTLWSIAWGRHLSRKWRLEQSKQ